jgi:hypothetical protein
MRRLYVGGLPAPCYDFMLTTFLNQALMALGICQVAGKSPIIACQVTPERNFAFIEFGCARDSAAAASRNPCHDRRLQGAGVAALLLNPARAHCLACVLIALSMKGWLGCGRFCAASWLRSP